MRYGTKTVLAGLLVLGLSGMGQAAPAGFTTQKGDGVTMDVPSTWQMMPKEIMIKLQEHTPAGTLLMGAQGEEGGMPQMMMIETNDPESTPGKVDAMSASEVKAWCDATRANLKAKTGKDIPVTCDKTKTASGGTLYRQMTVPANEGDMISMTWIAPAKAKTVTMTVMFPKAIEGKVTPQVKKMAESMKVGK